MTRLLIGILLCFGVSAHAAQTTTKKVSINASSIKVESVSDAKVGGFSKISVEGFANARTIGAPELPVKSILLKGTPQDIQVRLSVTAKETLKAVRPAPVQPQACRCETDKKVAFAFNEQAYETAAAPYTLNYIGAFRGSPITRLDVNLASYDAAKNAVTVTTEMALDVNAPEFNFERGDYKDYLIIAPEKLVGGVTAFADWKRSQGYNVTVETLLTPANNLVAISALIKKYYTESGVDFVMLIGDEKTIPMFMVKTSGSSQTPTDLKHFTMDGPTDNVPDMFYGRITADSAEQVTAQLAKSMEFEQKTFQNSFGLKKTIGIASNEGSNPSDKEYVMAIEEKFKSVMGTESTFLHQNDSVNSNPAGLNSKFNEGAFWLTYLGHGSGTSWPSMSKSYGVSDIAKINNLPVVKSIIIDVACMNGKLAQGYLGASFMKATTVGEVNSFGAVAYYGGTVNISWHPPAIMAQGIAFEHLKNKYHHIGEALLAGQLYLAANWTNTTDVVDNMEWYHLQGDPGMAIEFQPAQ